MNRQSKAIIIVGAVVAAVAVTAAVGMPYWTGNNSGSKPSKLPNPYVNRAFGFSIAYPSNWTAVEFRHLTANTTTLVSFNDSKSSIDIVANKMAPGDTLDSLDAKSKTLALQSDTGHSKSVESEGSGTVGGQDVRVRTWSITTPLAVYKQIVYHMAHRGVMLSISFVSTQENFDAELPQFNQSLKTFTVY